MLWQCYASDMSTPFLTQFSGSLVADLMAQDLLDVKTGHHAEVVSYLAAYLHKNRAGRSLLSTVEAGLITCGDVEEFYADQQTLKGIVETLKYGR
jgi:hypothetical protein